MSTFEITQRLSRLCQFDLSLAAVFPDVAGLSEICVVFARLKGEFPTVRAELADRLLVLDVHD